MNAAGASATAWISPKQDRVHTLPVGFDLVAAPPNQLGLNLRGDLLLDLEDRRVVAERRHADDLDVRGQE